MAYRGFQGNMAMTEKNQSQRLAEEGRGFFTDIEELISEKLKMVNNQSFATMSGFIDFAQQEKTLEFINDQKFITVVTRKPEGTISYLNNSLLFVPNQHWDGSLQNDLSISQLSMCLEEEFDKKNLTKALLRNQEMFKRDSTIKLLKVQALMSETRIHRKLKQMKDMRLVYRDLFELTKDPDILPYCDHKARGVMADIISSWFLSNEFSSDVKGQRMNEMEVAAFLAIPQNYLPQSYYLSCFNESSVLNEGFTNELLDTLLSQRSHKVHLNNVVVRFSNQIIRMAVQEGQNNRDLKQLDYSFNEDSISLYASFAEAPNSGKIALIVNMREFLKSISSGDYKQGKFSSKVYWRIVDERGNEILRDPHFDLDQIDYSISPINLGVWSLQLQNEQSSLLSDALESNEAIYLIGYVFVIIGLLVGLIITLRGLAQENRLTLLKSDFISSVSHELKSPVTSIRQMSELLVRDRIKTEDRKKEYYSTMLAQSERLSHLVENILDFSRLEYGGKKLRLELTDIENLVKETIEVFEVRLRYTGFIVHSDCQRNMPSLYIDREGIQQVLYNLLDNAYKYSGKSKEINVSLMRNKNEVEISVKDFGIGIHSRDQKKIFDRYYRSKGDKLHSIKGSGIGLAIVRQVVKAHNGRLEINSQLDKGSTFKVFLLIAKSKENEKNIDS